MFTILYLLKFWPWVTIQPPKSFLQYGYWCSRIMKNALGLLSLILLAGAAHLNAQTAANHVGVVTALDPAAKQLKIKTDAGAELSVALQDRTNYLRVGADLNLKNATKIALGDVAVGDRVLPAALSEDKHLWVRLPLSS